MRTTLDIDEDVLAAVRELGERERKSAGRVVSELVRRALLSREQPEIASREGYIGFRPLPPRGVVITQELIDRIRAEEGI